MKAKRILICFLTAILCFIPLSACSDSDSDTKNGAEAAVSFTDSLGRSVSVNDPKRVASLLGSFAEVWYLSGGTLVAAPEDAWEDFDLPLSDDTVNLGGTKDLSLELLLSSDPDFVIASANTPQHLEWESALTGAGITVAYFDVNGFEDYLSMLKICTDITGKSENYTEYGEKLQEKINTLINENTFEDTTALTLRVSAASIRAKNSDTVLGRMLKDFGCKNIADGDDSLLENLSAESIALLDPDKIFIIQVADDMESVKENFEAFVSENPLWQELTAVKNNQVYFMEKEYFNNKPNAKWAESYEKLLTILQK